MKMDKKHAYDRFILGQDDRCNVSTDCSQTLLNNNIMVVGGSGSGKTFSIAVPMLMHLQNANVVGVFTKKGMVDDIKKVMKAHGYRVFHIDFSDPKHSEYGFDPLWYCDSESDFKCLTHAIVSGNDETDTVRYDPYWNQSAESLLLPIIQHVAAERKEKSDWKGMSSVLQLLEGFSWNKVQHWDFEFDEEFEDEEDEDEKKGRPLFLAVKAMEKTNPMGFDAWKAYKELPDGTGACVASSLWSPLQDLFHQDVREVLENKNLDFRELMKRKTAVFVSMSPVSTVQHRFIALFYSLIFQKLFEYAETRPNKKLPYPVHVLCDDFATGCHVPNFPELISIFREKQISATILLQSESQLESIYGRSDATTIINNCDTYIYLGSMDLQTAGNISVRVNRPVDEILSMPLGREIFIRRGQKPIITNRYNVLEDPVYKDVRNGKFDGKRRMSRRSM